MGAWRAEVGVALHGAYGDDCGRWEKQIIEFEDDGGVYLTIAARQARKEAIARYRPDVLLHSWVISLENLPSKGKGLKAVATE